MTWAGLTCGTWDGPESAQLLSQATLQGTSAPPLSGGQGPTPATVRPPALAVSLEPAGPISDLRSPRPTERSPGSPWAGWVPAVSRGSGTHTAPAGRSLRAAAESLRTEPIVVRDWASHCFAGSPTNGRLRSELASLCCLLIKPQSYTERDNGTVGCRLELFYFMES